MDRYVIIRSDDKSISSPMSRKDAIDKVKEFDKKGISSYIVSEDEGARINRAGYFNQPKWN